MGERGRKRQGESRLEWDREREREEKKIEKMREKGKRKRKRDTLSARTEQKAGNYSTVYTLIIFTLIITHEHAQLREQCILYTH